MPRAELTPLNHVQWIKLLKQIDYPCELSARIVSGIESGVDIGFEGDRDVSRDCVNLRSADGDALAEAAVTAIIAADVLAGYKAGPFDTRPYLIMSISPIGAVPKGISAWRVIHHLSYPHGGDSINFNVADMPCTLGSFDRACEMIRQLGPGCWLIKIDVKSAYKLIPVRAEDWPLLGFRWRGKYYYERTLPFGLKSSCAIWEWYATAMHAFIEKIVGVEYIVHYIDDFLFVIQQRSVAARQLTAVQRMCEGLGVPIAPEKTEGPTTRLTFLGVELDTVAMTARLSESKLALLVSLLDGWAGKQHATKVELQSLCGKLQWACQVIRPGRSYLRRIIDFTTTFGTYGGSRAITREVRMDIAWWGQFAPTCNGHSMLYNEQWSAAPLVEIYTDACERGYGAVFGNRWIRGAWSPTQLQAARNRTAKDGSKLSMPYLELLALLLAVATWAPRWANMRITLRIDCLPVVQAIERRASTLERSMALIRALHTLCARHSCDVRAIHVPGVLNVSADALSRDKPGDEERFRAHSPHANQHAD
ncbi:MAG: hypothetical protein H7123_02315, partial [Thermoleophilia bacterium]|nr:hypothetical protein [Thermoleophilia bacterium]